MQVRVASENWYAQEARVRVQREADNGCTHDRWVPAVARSHSDCTRTSQKTKGQGLRAVASLAGTSYVENSRCDGAPAVSMLHVHGDADRVIRFEGDESVQVTNSDDTPAFYAGAREMVTRWSRRAGCDWPEELQPYASLDLDRFVPGPETQAFRVDSGCADGISIELWKGEGSGHVPGYGDAFLDALLDWLLAQG